MGWEEGGYFARGVLSTVLSQPRKIGIGKVRRNLKTQKQTSFISIRWIANCGRDLKLGKSIYGSEYWGYWSWVRTVGKGSSEMISTWEERLTTTKQVPTIYSFLAFLLLQKGREFNFGRGFGRLSGRGRKCKNSQECMDAFLC